MGYSRTPKAIQKVQSLLDEMVASKEDIEWIFKEPQKITYKLFEAIKFATMSNKEEFQKYSTLLHKYKIRIIEPNIVKAELKASSITPEGMVIRGVKEVLDIIGAVIENKYPKLMFPDAVLDELDDIDYLEEWCVHNGYTISTRDFKDKTLTLIREKNG